MLCLFATRDFGTTSPFVQCRCVDYDILYVIPGTSTCTHRAVCTGRYVGKTDNVVLYEFDDVRLFACCALNSELRYSCFTPTFE